MLDAEQLKRRDEELTYREEAVVAREQSLKSRERGTPSPADLAQSTAFYIKEYESLRAEILQTDAESRNLERNVVFAIGVSMAWLIAHKTTSNLVWWIPLAFVILGIMRSTALFYSFRVFAKYIRDVEKSFSSVGTPAGWETFRQKRSLGMAITAYPFWLALLVCAIYLGQHPPTVVTDPAPCPQVITKDALPALSQTPNTSRTRSAPTQ
jgi:hypothetical protein